MRLILLIPVLMMAQGLGCSKKEVARHSSLNNTAGSAAALAGQLQQLNLAASSYQLAFGRFPQTFQELVDKKMLAAIPDPPPGKKFIFNAPLRQVQAVDESNSAPENQNHN